ncbi:MAG: twin-arginine translocation signal domain-containing protein [Dehalococcoidia bacterium]|nr:twin-arginine translocation signal domain-containing protein [Dehalococcoidia bacterium]
METTRSWLPDYRSGAITRRTFLKATVAGAGAAALIACGGDDGGPGIQFQDAASVREPGAVWRSQDSWTLADETGAAVSGGTYPGSVDEAQDEHWDPVTVSSSTYRRHIYEQLMQRNSRPGIDPASQEGQYAIGGLAESWEFADGGLTVTFTLRPNVKFQNIAPVNGRVMDMDDWRTSTQRNAQEGTYRSFFNDIVDSVQYPDRTHMVLRLKAPYAPLNEVLPLYTWGWAIMPKELNTDVDLAKQIAIGTGFKQTGQVPTVDHA